MFPAHPSLPRPLPGRRPRSLPSRFSPRLTLLFPTSVVQDRFSRVGRIAALSKIYRVVGRTTLPPQAPNTEHVSECRTRTCTKGHCDPGLKTIRLEWRGIIPFPNECRLRSSAPVLVASKAKESRPGIKSGNELRRGANTINTSSFTLLNNCAHEAAERANNSECHFNSTGP